MIDGRSRRINANRFVSIRITVSSTLSRSSRLSYTSYGLGGVDRDGLQLQVVSQFEQVLQHHFRGDRVLRAGVIAVAIAG